MLRRGLRPRLVAFVRNHTTGHKKLGSVAIRFAHHNTYIDVEPTENGSVIVRGSSQILVVPNAGNQIEVVMPREGDTL